MKKPIIGTAIALKEHIPLTLVRQILLILKIAFATRTIIRILAITLNAEPENHAVMISATITDVINAKNISSPKMTAKPLKSIQGAKLNVLTALPEQNICLPTTANAQAHTKSAMPAIMKFRPEKFAIIIPKGIQPFTVRPVSVPKAGHPVLTEELPEQKNVLLTVQITGLNVKPAQTWEP